MWTRDFSRCIFDNQRIYNNIKKDQVGKYYRHSYKCLLTKIKGYMYFLKLESMSIVVIMPITYIQFNMVPMVCLFKVRQGCDR